MARKATDLLDVFRFSDDGGDEPKRDSGRKARRTSSPRKPDKKKSKAKARSSRGGGIEGLSLSRRQILLGSSALVLLLVLSFVLGLSAGRGGPSTDVAKIERRTPARVAIRAELPLLDPATRKAIDPGAIARILKRDYGLGRRHLRMQRSGSRIVIEVGPFGSKASAREFLRKSGLEMLHVHMQDPFRWPQFAPWDG